MVSNIDMLIDYLYINKIQSEEPEEKSKSNQNLA